MTNEFDHDETCHSVVAASLLAKTQNATAVGVGVGRVISENHNASSEMVVSVMPNHRTEVLPETKDKYEPPPVKPPPTK